jgi:hypothetical protein
MEIKRLHLFRTWNWAGFATETTFEQDATWPVFDAILQKGAKLCDAPCAILWTFDRGHFRASALHGVPQSFAEFLRGQDNTASGRGPDNDVTRLAR